MKSGDLKPENILLNEKVENPQVYLFKRSTF